MLDACFLSENIYYILRVNVVREIIELALRFQEVSIEFIPS